MASTFEEVAINNIAKQYAYTNNSDFIQKFGIMLDTVFSDIREQLVTDIYNIDTCKASALDYFWGRILKVSRGIVLQDESNYIMSDDEYRIALKLSAFRLNWNGTLPRFDEYIRDLFSDYGFTYIVDNKSMVCSIVCTDWIPDGWLYSFMADSDKFPRPAGVTYNIVSQTELFGFDGQELETFDNGIFGR